MAALASAAHAAPQVDAAVKRIDDRYVADVSSARARLLCRLITPAEQSAVWRDSSTTRVQSLYALFNGKIPDAVRSETRLRGRMDAALSRAVGLPVGRNCPAMVKREWSGKGK